MYAYTVAERAEREMAPGTPYAPYGMPRAVAVPTAPALGAAWAATKWHWAPVAGAMEQARQLGSQGQVMPPGASVVCIPETLLQLMRAAAWSTGRPEGELWVEAAREWLARRAVDDEPQPPTPAAAALAVPRPSSAWAAIDTLLADLRIMHRSNALSDDLGTQPEA